MSSRFDGPFDQAAFEKAEEISNDIIEDIITNSLDDERSVIARLEEARGQVLFWARLWLLKKLISNPPDNEHHLGKNLKDEIAKKILAAETGPECR